MPDARCHICGIAGSIALPGFALSGAIEKAVDRLVHRGPDGRGVVKTDLGWCEAVVGQTRLAIVDRSRIAVPFSYPYLGLTLAANCEVYNHRDLRAELADGTPWLTDCDAEVVARAWRRWGPDCLCRLNGAFALVIVDERERRVMLARDRAGERPLYYAVEGNRLHFASEAKALPVALEEVPCEDAEVFEFDCLESTPFKGVRRLGPGERIVLRRLADLSDPRPEVWWRLPLPNEIDDGMTYETACEQTEALLRDAITLRATRTEVAASVQLSGGLDSAIFQAIVRCPRVFCLTFPYDDWENLTAASLVAAGAEVVPVTFQLAEALAFLPAIAFHLDTPATWSALGHWFLGRRMRADGARIVLNGEGADELFAGYSRYRAFWWSDRARGDAKLQDYGVVTDRVLGGTRRDVLARYFDRSPDGRRREWAYAIVDRFAPGLDKPDADIVAAACRVDFYTTMQCLLRMADRCNAAHALECRSPFFDYRLMELAARMPTRHKIDERWSKRPLREMAVKLGVHDAVVNEQTKRGMVIPWNRWRQARGERGAWDRADFAQEMLAAWRRVFFSASA